ncbi:MAG: hypothetical protein R3C53_16430 [Pirellulaceae bacterium]
MTEMPALPGRASSGVVEPRWRIVLSRNQMNMSMPDDGTLPARDDTLWIATSVNLLTREYSP